MRNLEQYNLCTTCTGATIRVDQITQTITLCTWPFFCNPWEEEIWYQYLGKWNRILKDWNPVQGNFIRNGFPQKSNCTFIVRSLWLYNKHLYARLRLYFNDTLINKRPKRNLRSNTSRSLQPLPSSTPPPPTSRPTPPEMLYFSTIIFYIFFSLMKYLHLCK